MASRVSWVSEERLRARRVRVEIGHEIRNARLAKGLRQLDVARAANFSRSKMGRIERGESRKVTHEDLVLLAAAVGLRLSIQLYPAVSRLRDGRQAGMITRYLGLIGDGGWAANTEVPVGRRGDLRAIDLVLRRDGIRIAHEFVSALRDAQAQSRPLQLKAVDAGIQRLILVIAATHANRQAVAEAGAALRASFPLGTREVLAALRSGRDPGANGIVFL
ncbi:MAG TPA: helix-turn-helix transcriptional regulator [Candidatus Limnocylindria bacterium]|nr:helix-turn-helix transcriptional regulator [Candidatus Limnocylindria bacterium]